MRISAAAAGGYLFISLAAGMFLGCFLCSGAVQADQIYYVPLAEEQVRSLIVDLESPENVSDSIHTVVTIVPSAAGIIRYDHWEDGYEADIEHPAQMTTEIWGDGDAENGSVPGHAEDIIAAGMTITIESDVFANPRNSSQIVYDGHDRLASANALDITRTAYEDRTGFLVEAAGAFNGSGGSTRYEISPSVRNAMKYTSFAVIASVDNTAVGIDRGGDGSVDETILLNAGAHYVADGGVAEITTVTANQSIEACLFRSGQTS